jgi:hypothetical protein
MLAILGLICWRFTQTDNPFIGQAVAPEKPNADPKSSRKTRPDVR